MNTVKVRTDRTIKIVAVSEQSNFNGKGHEVWILQ